MELLEQVLGQEGQEGILCGPDLVAFVQSQELFQLLVLCEGRSNGPLLPQALLRRVRMQSLQAMHESTTAVESNLPIRESEASASRRSSSYPTCTTHLVSFCSFVNRVVLMPHNIKRRRETRGKRLSKNTRWMWLYRHSSTEQTLKVQLLQLPQKKKKT